MKKMIVDLRGGGLLKGPGTPTSDSILGMSSAGPVNVSNAEFVIKGSSARKLGPRALNYMNRKGRLPPKRLADGGTTAPKPPAPEPAPKKDAWEENRDTARKIVQKWETGPYVPSGERSLGSIADIPDLWARASRAGRKNGGSVVMKPKPKLMNLKHRGTVMKAMAKKRAGYQTGGYVTGGANAENDETLKEAGISTVRGQAALPKRLPDPSKVRVDPAPGAGPVGKAFNALMNIATGKNQESAMYKKGGMVRGGAKRGLRC